MIKRGVGTIILIDAEEDKDLAFEGYYILQDRLRAWGYKLENELLNERKRIRDDEKFWLRENTPKLTNGEFKVEVRDMNDAHVSTIYYIKMSVLGELKEGLLDDYSSYVKGMKESALILSENAKIREKLNKRLTKFVPNLDVISAKDARSYERYKTTKRVENWDCMDLVDGEQHFDVLKWIEQEAIYRANGKYADKFPHKTTFDQSWYNEEVVSWIGLGYIQGKRLVDKYWKPREKKSEEN